MTYKEKPFFLAYLLREWICNKCCNTSSNIIDTMTSKPDINIPIEGMQNKAFDTDSTNISLKSVNAITEEQIDKHI